MGNNVTQYKPGQFVKVKVPGRYRMAFAKKIADACEKCALSGKCYLSGSFWFRNNKNCEEALGWNGYLIKVK